MNGNYSLVIRNKDTNSIIYIPIDDKNKVSLSKIDSLTSKFKDEKSLLERLYKNKYINFSNGDIFIIYRYDDEIKNIEVAYSELGGIPLAVDSENPSKINWDSEFGVKFYNNFINLLKDASFRKKIYDDKKINEHLKVHIKNLINSDLPDDIKYHKKVIKKILMNYRDFRNIAFFVNTYLNNLKNPNYEKELKNKINERNKSIKDRYPNGLTKEDILPSKVANLEYYDKVLEKEYHQILKEEEKNSIKSIDLNIDDYNLYSDSDEVNEMIDLDDTIRLTEEEIEELGIRMDGLGKRR